MEKGNDHVSEIDSFIQSQLRKRRLKEVNPVQASEWLVEEGLRKNVGSRPGGYLRGLCRRGLITGAKKEGSKWKILKTI